MKKRNILYISAIMLLTGCSNEENFSNSTLSGNGEKTPLRINATLNTDRAGTRAEGNTFAVNDQLKVYIRHTTGGSKGSYSTVSAGQAPSLVSINVTSAGTIGIMSFARLFSQRKAFRNYLVKSFHPKSCLWACNAEVRF